MRRRACEMTVCALLLLHAVMVLGLIPQWSATHNEPGHLVAGLAYWYRGAYDLYGVNPPLPRMVATVGLLNQPSVCLDAVLRVSDQPRFRQEVELGSYFVDTNALLFHRLLCRARLWGLAWVTLGGWIIWRWATAAFGLPAGLVALCLWTFEPTVTAHAALATPDIPATVMGIAAAYAFAIALRTTTWLAVYTAGLWLGLALLCKFTLLLLLPAGLLVALLARYRHDLGDAPGGQHPRLRRLFLVPLVAGLVLNAGYGFTGTCTRLRDIRFVSDAFERTQQQCATGWLGDLPCPVPLPYIRGLDMQQRDFQGGRPSYLRGEWRPDGWWYYYLYAFTAKSPLGHLAFYAVAFCIGAAYLIRSSRHGLLWVTPLIIIVAASLKTGFTNHLRYILPVYPFVIILSGAAAGRLLASRRRLASFFIAVGLLGSATSTVGHYSVLLGYFNEAFGGPQEGWRHLAESNVDWGQDLCFLAAWLDDHRALKRIHLDCDQYYDPHPCYLRAKYPMPDPAMAGYAIVDTYTLTTRYRWLLHKPIAARIGTSFFVFKVSHDTH